MNRFASIAFLSLLSASAFAAAPASAPAVPASTPAASAAAPAAKVAPAPKFNILNSSSAALIDNAAAVAIWNANLTAKAAKLHPVKKFGYISEVNGGFDNKTCVVVARAMSTPLKGKNFIYDTKNVAVAYGSQAGATAEQCSALAKAKLTEAVQSIAATMEKS